MPEYDPVLFNFNSKPTAIINALNDLTDRRHKVEETIEKRKRIPLLLLLAGVPFICGDFFLWRIGYPACIFSFITLACGIGSLVFYLNLRKSKALMLPPLFSESQQIIHTLRDDIATKRPLFGSIDLTGSEQKTKIARVGNNALGMGITWYRDPWLIIKAKLYDGNMLRVTACRKLKQRDGYWGHGRVSGKRKWKSVKTKMDLQELKVTISVNPVVYNIANGAKLPLKTQIGSYFIEQFDASNGIIHLLASTANQAVTASDILGVLRTAYNLLQRKETA
jgi:hypothetical protein